MKTIDSTFALLDVKKGRKKLAKRVASGERIPVVIRGYLHSQGGRDDGTSIEFEVAVEDAREADIKAAGARPEYWEATLSEGEP